MKTTTATNLRKELFGILKKASHSIPTRVTSRTGDAVVLSYDQYQSLQGKKKKRARGKGLQPLVDGKILKPLGEKAEAEVMRYMGIK
jgi:prevent-host-death family protein